MLKSTGKFMRKPHYPKVSLACHRLCIQSQDNVEQISLHQWLDAINNGISNSDYPFKNECTPTVVNGDTIQFSFAAVQSGTRKEICDLNGNFKFNQAPSDHEKIILLSCAKVYRDKLYIVSERYAGLSHWYQLNDFIFKGLQELSGRGKLHDEIIFCGESVQEAIINGEILSGITYTKKTPRDFGDKNYYIMKKDEYTVGFPRKHPRSLSTYNGAGELVDEVRSIAVKHNMDFDQMSVIITTKNYLGTPRRIPIDDKCYYRDITESVYQNGEKDDSVVMSEVLATLNNICKNQSQVEANVG